MGTGTCRWSGAAGDLCVVGHTCYYMYSQLPEAKALVPAARESGKFSQLEALKSPLRPLLNQNLLLYCHSPNLKTRYLLIVNSLAGPCVLKVAD